MANNAENAEVMIKGVKPVKYGVVPYNTLSKDYAGKSACSQ